MGGTATFPFQKDPLPPKNKTSETISAKGTKPHRRTKSLPLGWRVVRYFLEGGRTLSGIFALSSVSGADCAG